MRKQSRQVHMLTRFQVVKSVGRFVNYTSSGPDLELSNCAVIFGHNGHGKSTLTAILRSLATNNPQLLHGRKCLKAGSPPQEVILKFAGGTVHKFANGSWEKPLGIDLPMVVFDKTFVEDNLFTTAVEAPHRKKMFGLVMGEEGKVLAEKLSTSMDSRKTLSQEMTRLERERAKWNSKVGGEDFVSLPDRESKDSLLKLITQYRETLLAKRADAGAGRLPRLEEVKFPYPNFQTWRSILLERKSPTFAPAKKAIAAHIRKHLQETGEAERFLATGTRLKKGCDCPYCGQETSPVEDLIKSFEMYFDGAYDAAKKEAQRAITIVGKWNPSRAIRLLIKAVQTEAKNARRWSSLDFGSPFPQVIDKLDEIKVEAQGARDRLLESVVRRARAPEEVEVSPHLIEDVEASCQSVLSLVDQVNGWIATGNLLVDGFRAGLAAAPTDQLERKIELCVAKLLRFEEEGVEFASTFQKTTQDLREVDVRISELKGELQNYTGKIFDSHQSRVNALLQLHGAGFSITGLEAQVDQRTTEGMASFTLTIEGQQTPLSAGNDGTPSFKNTLSEGDRNSLAFAFFVATVERLPNIPQASIVLDDPVSSLDRHRRRVVAETIRDLAGKCRQVIVLTHDDAFLKDLYHMFGKGAGFLEVLSDHAAGSRLRHFDIEQALKSDHRKRVEALRRYMEQNDAPAQTRRGDIRLVLEHALRFKYFEILEQKGNITTLGSIIDNLSSKLDDSLVSELRELNNFSSKPHHSDPDGVDGPEPTWDSLRPYVRRTLDALLRI